MEFDNIETIKRAIEIDAGVALLPEPTVLREVEAGTLVMVPLATDELVRPLGIIHRRGKEMGSTARRFIELLRSEGQNVASQVDTAPADCALQRQRAGGQQRPCGGSVRERGEQWRLQTHPCSAGSKRNKRMEASGHAA